MTKIQKTLIRLSLSTAFGLMAVVPVSHAFNFGNMMNPNRWFNGDRHDRYDSYYDDPYYGGAPYGMPFGGYGQPGGYGAPYGGLPYGVPGFGAPPAAYGAPAYGSAPGMAPPTSAPIPAVAAPAPTSSASQSEIETLKRRIEELEAKQQNQRPPQGNDWPSAPAFRPMNQY